VTRPFEGVKMLDFTQVLAGPMRVTVIKVEQREGEDMRAVRP
jgi:crotonobetainyl-CoA:carnitine CoA-transferase CaiB-like acyl-CoA transferase